MACTNGTSPVFRIEPGFRPEHREPAAVGYWEAFSRKLRYPLGPRDKAVAFIRHVLDPSHAISAVSENDGFLGVAGFKSPDGAFVGGEFADLAKVYGTFGAILRGALIGLLERPLDSETLLMDGVFVEPGARGLGVGRALLDAVERHAAERGLKQVRLDVIDTNPRARSLYERRGYSKRSVTSIGPLRPVFGFATATTMIKPVGGGENRAIRRQKKRALEPAPFPLRLSKRSNDVSQP